MKLERREILRYLRMGNAHPDAVLSTRIDALESELLAVARPQSTATLVSVSYEGPRYRVGPLVLTSADLRRTLRGATKAYLFAATLGLGVDQLLRRAAVTGASDLLIAQAIATAAIEQVANEAERALAGPRTPRFSPGYGDLPLEIQRDFLAAIDGARTVGITLTDAYLMIPSKSITAIIGVIS